MTNTISGARYAAEALKAYGVTHVFFMDAFFRQTLMELADVGIDRILPHSEKAAAYMADGYARVSGRPGVCFCQSVGAANLAAGLQDAYLHRSPVVALTGRKTPKFRYRNAYQEIDHAPLYAPVTKFHAEVELPEQFPLLLAQAFREVLEGTPRPVHLDMPGLQGEQFEAAEFEAPAAIDPNQTRYPSRRVIPSAADIDAAAAAIEKAQRPVLICGTGAVASNAHTEVLAFAEMLDIPVATSTGGRGIIPTTLRLHAGVAGYYGAPPARRVVAEADLAVFIGCHAGDQVTMDWTVPGPGTAIVQIDVDGREIGRNYAGVVGVLGDPREAVAALRSRCADQSPRTEWAKTAAYAVAEWRDAMAPALGSSSVPISAERLCAEVTEALPEDAVLVADTGFSSVWTSTLVELRHPGQTYLRAAGSLGWSFPAAIGAKCGAPDRPVLCFTGDGAFYYHLPELETARRRNIPVVVVVNNNSGFAQGLVRLRRHFADTPHDPDEVSRFGPTDFAAIARAFGVEGVRVERPDDIRPAIEQAVASNKVVVVDVVTDAECRAPGPMGVQP